MNLTALRARLTTRLSTVRGLTVYPTVPAKPECPCAILHPQSMSPHSTFDSGAADIRFGVQVLVQFADWNAAQVQLDGYVNDGPTSIVAALELDDASLTVESIDGYGLVTIGETSYGSVTFNVLAFDT